MQGQGTRGAGPGSRAAGPVNQFCFVRELTQAEESSLGPVDSNAGRARTLFLFPCPAAVAAGANEDGHGNEEDTARRAAMDIHPAACNRLARAMGPGEIKTVLCDVFECRTG